MERRVLGRTGLSVTSLGFGALELRGTRSWGGRPITDEQAERVLNAVLDAGINFVDTAPDYGMSEEYIGRFISSRRKEYYLATKCGCYVRPGNGYDQISHVWTRDNLLRNIEESLKRMKTDHVDVLQLHNPSFDPEQRSEITDTLSRIERAGHARSIGVSTTIPVLSDMIEMGIFDTFQIPYSALDRTHEDWISRVGELGFGTIIRGGVAQGEVAESKPKGVAWHVWQRAELDDLLDGMSRTEFMLRFTLTHPDVHTVIVGTMNLDHLEEDVVAARKGGLPSNVYEEAKRRLALAGEVPSPVDYGPGGVERRGGFRLF